LFKLLDVSDTGAIQVEDFVMGCLRLRGAAKAIDLATLMSETRRMHRHWRQQSVTLQNLMASFLQAMQAMTDGAPLLRPSSNQYFGEQPEPSTSSFFAKTNRLSEAMAAPMPPEAPRADTHAICLVVAASSARLRALRNWM